MLATVGSVSAQAPTPVGDAEQALVRAADAGDLALLDLVAHRGDDVVLAGLAQDQPIAIRLAAIRGCPALEAPEACIGALVASLEGRDPDLAPAAASSLWELARGLSADTLARREASVTPLREAAQRLDAVSEDSATRADLQRMAGLVAELLRAATTDGQPDQT